MCQSAVPFHWQLQLIPVAGNKNDFTTYGVAGPAEIAIDIDKGISWMETVKSLL